MNHVHDSHETTPVEDAWHKLCVVAGKPLSDALGDYFGAVFKQIAAEKAQPVEPRADGDVPEWDVLYRQFIDHKGWWQQSVLDVIKPAYESLRSQISRRVAEATAERDRRIAELAAERADVVRQERERIAANLDYRQKLFADNIHSAQRVSELRFLAAWLRDEKNHAADAIESGKHKEKP